MKADTRVEAKEVKKGIKATRQALTAANSAIDTKDLVGARNALERAQHLCFEARSVCENGGKFQYDE